MADVKPPEKSAFVAFKSIVGEWIGECQGDYPTIKAFKYGEMIEIVDTNKPFLAYSSSTWKKGDKNKLMHSEAGFIRFPSNNSVDFIISQCTGIQEISCGDIMIADPSEHNEEHKTDNDGNSAFKIVLESKSIARVSTAKQPHITNIQRVYTYDSSSDSLSYEIWMNTTNTKELTKHLSGSFKRASNI